MFFKLLKKMNVKIILLIIIILLLSYICWKKYTIEKFTEIDSEEEKDEVVKDELYKHKHTHLLNSEIGNRDINSLNTENYKESDKLSTLIKKLDSDEISSKIIKDMLEELINNDVPFSAELLGIFNNVKQLINNYFTTESKKNNIDQIKTIINLIEKEKEELTNKYDFSRVEYIENLLNTIKNKIDTLNTIVDSSEEDISEE